MLVPHQTEAFWGIRFKSHSLVQLHVFYLSATLTLWTASVKRTVVCSQACVSITDDGLGGSWGIVLEAVLY